VSEMAAVVGSLVAGAALGLFFYGALWFTVRRLVTTGHPVLLTLGSFWLRLLVVLAVFLFLTKQGLEYVLIAMASFILGRLAISRLLPEGGPSAKCT